MNDDEGGRVDLVPVLALPSDQAWFWTERWQAMERDADANADVATGRATLVDGLEELISHLEA